MKPNFFKVYIVKENLKTIWIRDCFKLEDTYAYLRPTRSAGTELKIDYWINPKITSDKYFKSLKEAKDYVFKEKQIKIDKLKSEIERLKKSMEYIKSSKNNFEFITDFDYDDRVDYDRYIKRN